MALRVLILAHAHPEIVAGGGERAALSLFQWLERDPAIDPILVTHGAGEVVGHSAPFGAFRGNPRQIVATLPYQDEFSLESLNFTLLQRMVEELILRFRPDVVHVEHFSFWSLDLLELLERHRLPVVMTLHEFLLICRNDGQMTKTFGGLCHAESPAECAICFPDRSAGEFFLRKAMVLERLASVACFVSPSRFLARRFAAWGIAPERIRVIDNPIAPEHLEADPVPPPAPTGDRRIAIGYFGQLTRYKGVEILLQAIKLLPETIRERLTIGIHGANLAVQPAAFQERFAALVEDSDGAALLRGAYDNRDVLRLMQAYDWIVVPSTWWENSPIVIQEALVAGRPVLCSRIGGMAEKIEDGVPGATFRPGDPEDLAARITDIVLGTLRAPAPAIPLRALNDARVSAYADLYAEARAVNKPAAG